MSFYDYKVVPAPRRSKRTRGVNDPADLFALTLTEAINEHARAGWEYVRAESLPAETPGGWFSRSQEELITVLVFRRHRETLGPRIESQPEPVVSTPEPDATAPAPEPRIISRVERPEKAEPRPAAEPRAFADRMREATSARREPVLSDPARPVKTPSPLRPAPRLEEPE